MKPERITLPIVINGATLGHVIVTPMLIPTLIDTFMSQADVSAKVEIKVDQPAVDALLEQERANYNAMALEETRTGDRVLAPCNPWCGDPGWADRECWKPRGTAVEHAGDNSTPPTEARGPWRGVLRETRALTKRFENFQSSREALEETHTGWRDRTWGEHPEVEESHKDIKHTVAYGNLVTLSEYLENRRDLSAVDLAKVFGHMGWTVTG